MSKTKFSISEILRDEFRTLNDFSTKKTSILDVFINLILPFFIAIFLVYLGRVITGGTIDSILTAFSVFAALLLNLMILVYTVVTRENSVEEDRKKDKLKLRLLRETYTNIQFAVLVSVFIIIVLLLMQFMPTWNWLDLSFSIIVYYFVFVFVFTILMILKRTYVIMKGEMGEL